MYNSLTSCHGDKDDLDCHVDNKVDDMFITASGRFIAPTSTLPRMRRSMTLVGVSPYSAPDSPDIPALGRKRFRLVSKSFELCDDEDKQVTGSDKEDMNEDGDSGVKQHYQEFLTTSSLPTTPFKVRKCINKYGTDTYVLYIHIITFKPGACLGWRAPYFFLFAMPVQCVFVCACAHPQGHSCEWRLYDWLNKF